MVIDYSYDSLYLLTTADYSNDDYYHYTYDTVGNRLSEEKVVNSGSPIGLDYVYDNANRLVDMDSTPYTWDNNGNASTSSARRLLFVCLKPIVIRIEDQLSRFYAH